MATLASHGFLEIDGARLEYRFHGPQPSAAPTIILLHEGLGSLSQWGNFPEKLVEATDCGVFVYSRAGYGQSSPVSLPRPLDYMDVEALQTLPKILEAIGFERGFFVGHSDGASIATIYLGGVQDHRIRGLVLLAPHFFVEDMCVKAIAEINKTYAKDDSLRTRLVKHHAHVDNAFRGWADAWLDPKFKTSFDLHTSLAHIRVPLMIIQSENDPYGTIAQIKMAEEECYCPVEHELIPNIGHAPHREAPEATLNAASAYINRMRHMHGEG